MPKAFSEHEKRIIGERLLQEGDKLFSARGLKKTSIEELSTAAGISKAAFYLFFESKEALFMDVVERAEEVFRRAVLAAVAEPGSTPRSRLYRVLKKAFTHWKDMPILQFFTSGDYQILLRRIPAHMLEEHLRSDETFAVELVRSCREAGIPVTVQPQQMDGLLHALFFSVLHEDELGARSSSGAIDILLELTAAFCLGEVTLQVNSTAT